MTTRYQHPNVADAALNYVKANGTQLVLVAGLAASDTYTQAMAKKVASVALASGDYTIAADGTARKLTTASKTGTATATTTAGTDLGFMITDGSATILLVFEESSDMAVTSGNPVTFPAQNYSIPQPVAA